MIDEEQFDDNDNDDAEGDDADDILECGRTWLVNWKTRILGRWTTLAQK